MGAQSKGEKLWRMPLADEYRPNIKSEIADLKNVGGRVCSYPPRIVYFIIINIYRTHVQWSHLFVYVAAATSCVGRAIGLDLLLTLHVN